MSRARPSGALGGRTIRHRLVAHFLGGRDSARVRRLVGSAAAGRDDAFNRMAMISETDKRTSILLWFGIAAPLLRHLFIYSLGIATPGYSARRDFLSELSAFDAPYAVPMGLFGVGLVGLMMMAAAFGLYRVTNDRPLGRLTACLVGLSGLGICGCGPSPV